MLTEVRLVVSTAAVTLTFVRGDKVVDEEAWTVGRKIGSSEAAEVGKAIFDDAYDAMNWMVYGD